MLLLSYSYLAKSMSEELASTPAALLSQDRGSMGMSRCFSQLQGFLKPRDKTVTDTSSTVM